MAVRPDGLFHHAPHAMVLLDATGEKVQDANAAFLHLLAGARAVR
jgi:hypothetical protein